VAVHGVARSAALASNDERAPEGTAWNDPSAIVLEDESSHITWDLEAAAVLNAIWVQADANDTYVVSGSIDGQNFVELGRIGPVEGHGLRGRVLFASAARVRFVRVAAASGDGFYSLAEVAAFCRPPAQLPPAMRVATAATPAEASRLAPWWNDEISARWQLALALLAFALLHWSAKLRRQGRPTHRRALRDRLLAVLGIVAALSYVNFGAFHFGNFLHAHEWTHYYLGSKYSTELGYERLYECITTADVEAGLRRRVERRAITNLRTNLVEATQDVVAHPERCKRHFSDARWSAFVRDVGFFRERMAPRGWDDLQLDHGYNATPVWNAVGRWLTNLAPASTTQQGFLAALDPLLLGGCVALIWWGFGWRILAIALLVFATNHPSRFSWNGGAFLRFDWLFFMVAGIACLRRDRPWLAGIALAAATSLRIFPILLLLGPAIALLRQAWLHRIDPRLSRLLLAATIAGAALFGLSLAGSGGWSAYRSFAANTTKHQATAMVNNLGLRTVLSWRPSEVGRFLKDDARDPWQRWKDARLRAWQVARPLWFLAFIATLVPLAASARHRPPWVLAALGIAVIPFAVELLSYYFAFVMALALLASADEETARILLALTAFTQFVAWAPLRAMSLWQDEQYTLMAAGTLVAFATILWRFRHPRTDDEQGAPSAFRVPASVA
jgi:hypothetical protein